MLRLLVVLTYLLITTVASAAPQIRSVDPPGGPIGGGTNITIRGDELVDCSSTCGSVDVYVGGRRAEVLTVTADTITARTAAYTGGVFDVTVVRDGSGFRVVAKNAFAYGHVAWERRLIPILLEGTVAGAYGSQWRTELAGHLSNFDGRAVGDVAARCRSYDDCVGYVRRNQTFVPAIDGAGSPGRLLYTLGNQQAFTFSLRCLDTSRTEQHAGTTLPVPIEDDAYGPREDFGIVSIPNDRFSRAKLRVYSVDGIWDEPVAIAVESSGGSEAVRVALQPTRGASSGDFPSEPGYGEFDLSGLFNTESARRLTVTLRTPREGRFWAFVAVTNNATQQITAIWP